MSSLLNREVTVVRTTNATHVTGLGNVKTILDRTTAADIKMFVTEFGVQVTGTGPKGEKFEFIVPYAQCMSIQLVPEKAT